MTGDNRLQFLGLFGSQMEAIRSSTSMIATSARGHSPHITLQCISSHIKNSLQLNPSFRQQYQRPHKRILIDVEK